MNSDKQHPHQDASVWTGSGEEKWLGWLDAPEAARATLDDVRANSGFGIEIPERYGESPTPTAEELRLLREVIDPSGIVIGK